MSSIASPPFNDSTADITICSSDGVVFRLHRVILSLASDFFKDMLSLPQPAATSYHQGPHTTQPGGTPIIEVSESSDVLERLFRLCYPVDDPVLDTIGEVRSTLEAAMKYQMSEAIKITKRKLLALAAADPLRVYCVACRFSLEEEASAAAKEVFKQKAQDRYVEDLEETTIGAYHRLLSYCERRGRVRERFRFTVHRDGRDDPPVTSTPSIGELTLELPELSVDPKIASHPFDMAEAEIGLVSSDGVEFRVFKHILQLSSPPLYDRANDLPASAPVTINVSEPSRILSILLQLSYPTLEPRLEDLHDISAALTAAEKYEMHRASQVLRAAMNMRKDVASEDPVTLYALACHFGMRELAVAAAKRTLRTELMRTSVSELDAVGVSAGCFYRLLEYHRRCRAAVRSIFETGDWIEPDMLTQLRSCCRRAYSASPRTPCWYDMYMTRIAEEAWPRSKSVMKDQLLQNVLEATQDPGYSCGYCMDVQGIFLLIRFSKYVAEKIESLEKNVALQWMSLGAPPSPAPLSS
ncbi:hypothetical protein C8Q76DRAFT_339573 [Earliella scabrosa]|nr:hypothetical protein C8Q76DRAFT_339573 [Earliella scabrosa]